MGSSPSTSSTRRNRLTYQSLAFLIMMIVPVFLYCAAKAEASEWLLILLGIMAMGMVLAMVVS